VSKKVAAGSGTNESKRKDSVAATKEKAAQKKIVAAASALVSDSEDDDDVEISQTGDNTGGASAAAAAAAAKKRMNPKIARMQKRWATIHAAGPLIRLFARNDPDQKDVETGTDDAAYNIAKAMRGYLTPKQSKTVRSTTTTDVPSNDESSSESADADAATTTTTTTITSVPNTAHLESYQLLSALPGGSDLPLPPSAAAFMAAGAPDVSTRLREAKTAFKRFQTAGWRVLTYDEISIKQSKKRKNNAAKKRKAAAQQATDGETEQQQQQPKKRRGGIDSKQPISPELQEFLKLDEPFAARTACVSGVFSYFKNEGLEKPNDTRQLNWDDKTRALLRPTDDCKIDLHWKIYNGQITLTKFNTQSLLARHFKHQQAQQQSAQAAA